MGTHDNFTRMTITPVIMHVTTHGTLQQQQVSPSLPSCLKPTSYPRCINVSSHQGPAACDLGPLETLSSLPGGVDHSYHALRGPHCPATAWSHPPWSPGRHQSIPQCGLLPALRGICESSPHRGWQSFEVVGLYDRDPAYGSEAQSMAQQQFLPIL